MSLSGRRPLGLLLGGVLGTIAVTVAVMAFTGTDDGPTGEGGAGASFVSAHAAVCQAADAARQGDARRARALFLDLAHQSLHELAAAVQERDRAAAARLLEAKGRVETELENPGQTLAGDLDTLAATTGRAMAAAGATDPGSCRPA